MPKTREIQYDNKILTMSSMDSRTRDKLNELGKEGWQIRTSVGNKLFLQRVLTRDEIAARDDMEFD